MHEKGDNVSGWQLGLDENCSHKMVLTKILIVPPAGSSTSVCMSADGWHYGPWMHFLRQIGMPIGLGFIDVQAMPQTSAK